MPVVGGLGDGGGADAEMGIGAAADGALDSDAAEHARVTLEGSPLCTSRHRQKQATSLADEIESQNFRHLVRRQLFQCHSQYHPPCSHLPHSHHSRTSTPFLP